MVTGVLPPPPPTPHTERTAYSPLPFRSRVCSSGALARRYCDCALKNYPRSRVDTVDTVSIYKGTDLQRENRCFKRQMWGSIRPSLTNI